MTRLVDSSEIESIVGADRHRYLHLGRAVSESQTVYILHSAECLASGVPLDQCDFSLVLDHGIEEQDWAGCMDVPVRLDIEDEPERLVPRPDDSEEVDRG